MCLKLCLLGKTTPLLSPPKSSEPSSSSLADRIAAVRDKNLELLAPLTNAPKSSPISPVKLINPKDSDQNKSAVAPQEKSPVSSEYYTPSPNTYSLSPIRIVPQSEFLNFDLGQSAFQLQNSTDYVENGSLKASIHSKENGQEGSYRSDCLERLIFDPQFVNQLRTQNNQYPLNRSGGVFFCTLIPRGDLDAGSRTLPRSILPENWD